MSRDKSTTKPADGPLHWSEDLAQVAPTVQALEGQHGDRLGIDKACARLYWSRPSGGQTSDGMFGAIRQNGENSSKEVVDAAGAFLCRMISPEITPSDAEFGVQDACEALTMLVHGVLNSNEWEILGQRFFLDGAVFCLGIIKGAINPETSEVELYKCDPTQCFWDDAEGDDPFSFFEVSAVPRRVLMARYPEKAKEIKALGAWTPKRIPGVDPPQRASKSDTVKVIEAWCKKIGKVPGRHAIVAGNVVLEGAIPDKPGQEDTGLWDFDRLPLAFFRMGFERKGLAGVSLVRQIANYDLENKDLAEVIKEGLAFNVPWAVVPKGSTWKGPTDVPLQVIEYDAEQNLPPPKVQIPDTVGSQVLAQRADNRTRIFAVSGLNPDLAGGQRPAGLNSEPAQMAAVELAGIRQLQHQARWGQAVKDVARLICMLARVAYKSKAKVVQAPGTDIIARIKWGGEDGINLKEQQYNVTATLTSGLNQTFAGRLAELSTLKKEGAISQPEYVRSLGIPDVKKQAKRTNAPVDLAESIVSKALNKGVITNPPSILLLLQSLVPIAALEYQRAKTGNTKYPPENVAALGKVHRIAEARLKKLQEAMAPPPGAPAPAPSPGAQPQT